MQREGGGCDSRRVHYGHKAVINTYNFFRQHSSTGYFVICDLDAYVSRPEASIPNMRTAQEYAVDNITDALALGVPRGDIIVQSNQDRSYYNFTLELSKILPFNLMKGVLGHTDLGKYTSVYLQVADILHPQIKGGPATTLVPVGIDQRPILRLTQEVVDKTKGTYGFVPPSVIYTAHVPSLANYRDKMSKSKPGSALMINSTEAQLNAVVATAVTGGRDTRAEQVKYGGIPEACPVYELYRFNHPDSAFVRDVVHHQCVSGQLLCGADKTMLKDFLRPSMQLHPQKRAEYADMAKEIMRTK